MPFNPNIRDLLQKSFSRYSNMTSDTINVKRNLEDESLVEKPLKKKKKLQDLEKDWDVSRILNVSDLTSIAANEKGNPTTSPINEQKKVKKKKKKKAKEAEASRNPKDTDFGDPKSEEETTQFGIQTADDLSGSTKNEAVIEESRVIKKKKKLKELEKDWDVSRILNVSDLNTNAVIEKDNPITSQMIDQKKVKKKKKKTKETDHLLNTEDTYLGDPKSKEGTTQFGIETRDDSTGSQRERTIHSEDLDEFSHMEFSQQKDSGDAEVSCKVSTAVEEPGRGKDKKKRRKKNNKINSVDFIFDTENEEDSVEEEFSNAEAIMVRIKSEPEEIKPDLISPIQQKGGKRSRKGKVHSEKPDYFNSDEEYTIKMTVTAKSIEKLNHHSSGQINAAINWILSQSIKVSPLNMTHQRNYFIFEKDVSDKIVEETGFPLRFFTEAEDEEILQRIQFLEKNGVITSAIGFCNELKEVNELSQVNADKEEKSRRRIHRDTLRIIGLYLCQNLTNRLAYYTTERMLKLMDKLTATPKKAETVTGRRPWTLDDDKTIVKSVLFDNISQSYVRVESVNDKVTAWDRVVAQFPEGQRSQGQVRERWTRVLKVRLLETEMDPEQTWTYRRELLEHIIRLGVADRREIRWKEVALEFPNKTSAALNQDFWNMIRRSISPDVDFQTSLEMAHQKLDRQQAKNIHGCKILKKEEDKSELLDWYRTLKFRS